MAEFLQHLSNGLVIGGLYALIGLGMTLILGIMDVVNFAHGELYMLGGFLVYTCITFFGLSFLPSILVASLIVMVIGWVVEKGILRPLRDRPLESSLLAMIGLSIVLQNAAMFIWTPIPQNIVHSFSPLPLVIGSVRVTELRLFSAVTAVILIAAAHLIVQYTRLGKSMRATFQDKETAALMGVRVDNVYSFTFAFGAGLAAVAGALLGAIFVVQPTMGNFAVSKAFAVVILGGMGSFPGAIVGGLILGLAESLGAGYIASGYKDAIAFALIILILLVKPSGLFGVRGVSR